MDVSRIIPGPAQLKALSHPMRLRILGLLRLEGPATATGLAQRLQLNSGATSYHLRQLERHGFVADDAELGDGRDRWWRAAHQSTRTQDPATEEERDAQDAFWQAVAVVHTETLQRAVEEHGRLPDEWQRASTLSDWGIRLTPRRARALLEALDGLLGEIDEDPEEEDGAEIYRVVLHAFPHPGAVVTDEERE
ncbi:MAG TPA: helix-turn-helix domain-containing protein [Microbacteriaceae bacterium]|nr:helix-turn-helix domain-containing protein [Microbacteriaceae bacterium]